MMNSPFPPARSPRPTGFFQRLAILPREKTDALMLIITCTMVLLPFAEHSPLWLNSVAGLLILWRVWITVRGYDMPKKWLLTTIAIVLLAGVYVYFQTWFGKDAGISLLVVLACLKMLEMKASRDAVVVLFTCYFLLVGQLMYSQSLLAAIYVVLCICMLISTQFAFQYHHLTPSLLKRLSNGFKLMGLAIPLALILFVFFPRFQGPLWGKPQGTLSSTSALADSMEPGNMADLAHSDQIAFRVRFPGITPSDAKLYWRGIVLDTYNGARWTGGIPPTAPNPGDESTPPSVGVAVTQEIILEPHNQRWLFGLDSPNRIQESSVLSNNGNGLVSTLTRYGEMRSANPIQDRIRYTMLSNLSNSAPLSEIPPITLAQRREAERKSLQLPAGFNPKTIAWAQQLREKNQDPAQLAFMVLRYFHDQPFRYTLAPPPVGKNQADDFIFGTQAGFCEHYSSAFVVVMRAMRIPARVVMGYQGGEMNPVDGLMTIRQSDAHAWAEVWIEPRGWVRYDPTGAVSPNRIEHGFKSSFPERGLSNLINFTQQTWIANLAKELRMRWDATNSAWNLWALNYNLTKQKELLSSLIDIKNPQASQVGMVMMIAASFVVAALTLLLLGGKTTISPLDKIYATFCQYMSKEGYARLPYEGARDYGQRLEVAFQNKKVLWDFLSLYAEYKYGKTTQSTLNSDQLLKLKALLKLCLQQKPSPPS